MVRYVAPDVIGSGWIAAEFANGSWRLNNDVRSSIKRCRSVMRSCSSSPTRTIWAASRAPRRLAAKKREPNSVTAICLVASKARNWWTAWRRFSARISGSWGGKKGTVTRL